jgi:hypothetical protein
LFSRNPSKLQTTGTSTVHIDGGVPLVRAKGIIVKAGTKTHPVFSQNVPGVTFPLRLPCRKLVLWCGAKSLLERYSSACCTACPLS